MPNDFLKIRIKKEEYLKFQEACSKKDKTMSEVLRYFVNAYTKGENIVLLDIDKELLTQSHSLCKEKKVKLNDLMKFLLSKAIKNKDKLDLK